MSEGCACDRTVWAWVLFQFDVGELMRRWLTMECSVGVGVWLSVADGSPLLGVATECFVCLAWGSRDSMALCWHVVWGRTQNAVVDASEFAYFCGIGRKNL